MPAILVEILLTVIRALFMFLFPAARTPRGAAPDLLSAVQAFWAAVVSTGAILQLLTVLQTATTAIPDKTIAGIAFFILHLMIALYNQYVSGPAK